jgi:hypothetical protein
MKKICLIAALGFMCSTSLAQVTTTLVVSPTPPGTLTDWAAKKEVLTYLVVNQGQPRQALIKAELKTADGTLAAATNLAKARVINLERNNNLVLNAGDVLPIETMIFYGKFKKTLERTGKLPADNYQLCVQLVTPIDFLPVSEQRCRNFTIAAFQLPIPVIPAHEAILDLDKSKTTITFRWTPVAPKPTQPITYRLTIFGILENQTPMQALRSNQPLLAKDVIGTTQYIWQHQLAINPCCQESGKPVTGNENVTDTTNDLINAVNAYGFIWTIQTFDQNGQPFGDGNINGDGISEPAVFLIDRRPAAARQRSGPPSRIIYLNNMKGNRN